MNNLMGLIPIFPGGANVTGNIAITLVLALCTFVLTNVYGTKAYWKEIFWPDVPTWLKAPIPMMPLIEFFGIFTKPFALMIRLFANIMAGHAAVLSLVAIIFITVKSGNQRLDDGGVGGIQHFHECAGNSGGIHPGIRLHDAVGRVYRSVAGEGTCRKIIDSKKIKV